MSKDVLSASCDSAMWLFWCLLPGKQCICF